MTAMVAILDRQDFNFDLQVATIFPSKFQVKWLSVQEKFKIDFQDGSHGGHLGFQN